MGMCLGQEDVDGLRQREVEATKAAADCQEMLSELQDFAAHQQAQIQQLTEEMEVSGSQYTDFMLIWTLC